MRVLSHTSVFMHVHACACVYMHARMDYFLRARDPTASANSNEPIIVRSFPPLLFHLIVRFILRTKLLYFIAFH